MEIRPPRRLAERADHKRRIVAEYGKGMSVFSDPVSLGSLLGFSEEDCRSILEELVTEGFLQRQMMNEVPIYFRDNEAAAEGERSPGLE